MIKYYGVYAWKIATCLLFNCLQNGEIQLVLFWILLLSVDVWWEWIWSQEEGWKSPCQKGKSWLAYNGVKPIKVGVRKSGRLYFLVTSQDYKSNVMPGIRESEEKVEKDTQISAYCQLSSFLSLWWFGVDLQPIMLGIFISVSEMWMQKNTSKYWEHVWYPSRTDFTTEQTLFFKITQLQLIEQKEWPNSSASTTSRLWHGLETVLT